MSTASSTLFSVITVNLNHVSGLSKTLESVRIQQECAVENLVIDGGSTDGSLELISDLSSQLAYAVSEKDRGIYHAMNKGIAAAKGEWLLFLNSGDLFCDDLVLKRVCQSLPAEADWLYGDSFRLSSSPPFKRYLRKSPTILTPLVLFRTGICHQSVFFRRDLFERFGLYDESYKIAGDWEFEARLFAKNCPARYLGFPISVYEGQGISHHQRQTCIEEESRLLKAHFPETVIRDYRNYHRLETEVTGLREVDRWRQDIRKRSWFLNLAMITKWAWQRIFRKK